MAKEMCMPGLDGHVICVDNDSKAKAPSGPLPKMVGLASRHVEIEEQIVGSSHPFTIGDLSLENAGSARVTLAIRPSADRTSAFRSRLKLDPSATLRARAAAFSSDHIPTIPISNKPVPIRVRFAPTEVGVYNAELVVTVHYHDRRVEERIVTLRAKARRLDQLPSADIVDAPGEITRPSLAPTDDNPSKTVEGADPGDLRAFDRAAAEARDAAYGLSRLQDKGVENAEQQAMSYSKRPPESSWVSELAGLAISMGVAGLAGTIAAKLAPRLAGILRAKADSPLGAGTTEAVQDGAGSVLRWLTSEVPAGLETAGRKGIDETPAGGEAQISTNQRIEFFRRQSLMLFRIDDKNRDVIYGAQDRLAPHLRGNPALAISTLRGLGDVLKDVRDHDAMTTQSRISERQWVALVAQDSVGRDRVTSPSTGKQRSVTRLTDAHHMSRGVLRLGVTVGDAGGVAVTSASILGISQEIADALRTSALADAGVPIQINVGRGASITRDEAGRIRIVGYVPHDWHPETGRGPILREEQMHRAAEALCGRVLSRTLHDWGVREVTTDDGSGRGDPK